MLKNKAKVLIAIVAVILLITTFSFATDPNVSPISTEAGDNARTGEQPVTTSEEETQQQPEIRNDDLYITDDNVIMDQLVDGNVYIFGNNVEITGKVNGNLYVMGNKVNFKKGSYIVQSIYVCANEVEFSGDANDLYVASRTLNVAYDSFIVRDLKVSANTLNLNGGIGRNAVISAANFNFITEGDKPALIYGNLKYSSNNELTLSKENVQGDISFSKYTVSSNITTQELIFNKVISFGTLLLFTAIIYLLGLWLAPKFMKSTSSYISNKAIPAIGIGFLALIIIPIVSLLLMFTIVGISLSFAILALYLLLLLICSSIVITCITNKIKEKFNFTKKYMTALTLVITTLIICILTQIPYIGGFIGFILTILGLGIMFMHLFTMNKKAKTEVEVEIKVDDSTIEKKD